VLSPSLSLTGEKARPKTPCVRACFILARAGTHPSPFTSQRGREKERERERKREGERERKRKREREKKEGEREGGIERKRERCRICPE
jgi:hypothetical protein